MPPRKKAAPPPLRAVKADEQAPPPGPPMSLDDAVEAGDYYQILIAQRREIARSIPGEKGPAKAALHRQLSLISKEVEGIDAQRKKDGEGIDFDVEDEAFDAEAL